MGITDLLKGKKVISEVIQWKGAPKGEVVFRHPSDEFNWGAQLVVQENQKAIFFKDGKALDSFGPGRHTLTTANLPFLTKALGEFAFGETPFKCQVIFISVSQFNGLFGFRGMSTEYMPIMGHGQYWFRIEDPKVFVIEVVGNQNAYTTEEVTDFIRSFINEKMIDEVSEFDVKTVFTKLKQTSAKIKSALGDEFSRIGVELIDLKFEGVDTDERGRELLFRAGLVGKGGQLVVGGEIMRETAKELGSGTGGGAQGAAFGAGMMMIPPLTQMMQQPQAGGQAVCLTCGRMIPVDSKFCPACGAKRGGKAKSGKTAMVSCSKCKAKAPAGTKFCPKCGKKL